MNRIRTLGILVGLALAGTGWLGAAPTLDWIRVASDGVSFAQGEGKKFIAWGFNYDHDAQGRLLAR